MKLSSRIKNTITDERISENCDEAPMQLPDNVGE